MKQLFLTLLYPLSLIEYGSTLQKIEVSLLAALLLSPIMYLAETFNIYVLTDRSFVIILMWCLTIDLIFGVWKHLKLRNFSFKLMFIGFVEKVFISYLSMILFNAIGNIEEFKLNPAVLQYFKLVTKLMMCIYVAGSAFSSSYVITKGKFPPVSLMKRFKSFNASLDVNDLTKTKQSTENFQELKDQEK